VLKGEQEGMKFYSVYLKGLCRRCIKQTHHSNAAVRRILVEGDADVTRTQRRRRPAAAAAAETAAGGQ
jgi:hypothetical protein